MSDVTGAEERRVRRRTRRLAFAASAVAIIVFLSLLVWVGWHMHLTMLSALRLDGLISTSSAIWEFQGKTNHAPHSVDDFLRAGIWTSTSHAIVLAPLDDRFFEYDIIANMFEQVLGAYCTEHFPGSDTWTYIGVWDHRVQEAPPAKVLQWVADQREAITWLDESFPVADLERIAQTESGRRGRMASAILGYRREQAAKKAPETQKQGP